MQINISFALLGLLGLGAVVFGIYVFFLHEKLREKKRLLMVLPDPVILIDVQRRVIYLNRAAEQFMGLSHPRAIGRSLTQIGLGEKDQEVLFSRERVAPLQIQWGGGIEVSLSLCLLSLPLFLPHLNASPHTPPFLLFCGKGYAKGLP
ncbi:MAG: PAS domain-containing protein [Anaerolineales bacterium]|nr:PAS domain-containing protein [Anaerolineales bacterium]